MELPHLGQQCSESTCKRLDFLPVKCDACEKIFCKDHMFYAQHNCETAYKKDVQVPVCPLCNNPVPVKRGEQPDVRVGEHIDRDCQSDPAKSKRRIYTNKCSHRGCKQREMIDITCSSCRQTFCLKHRHPQDHGCTDVGTTNGNKPTISRAGVAALSRLQGRQNASNTNFRSAANVTSTRTASRSRTNSNDTAAFQGSLGEDEALARALQLSLTDANHPTAPLTQQEEEEEEEDRQLAEALARSEREQRNRQPQHSDSNQQGSKDRCTLS